MSSTESIFALATAPGKSGVAIIRLSGSAALRAALALTGRKALAPRVAHYADMFDPLSGQLLDRGLALYFPAPHSFTGEDVVELHLHGGIAIIKAMLSVLSAMPELRLAEPGEFTRRAFLYGKMDLMEAEGLADLIDAETSEQRTQAMRQMRGELSDFYENLRTRIIECLGLLEAYIDFPDEEIPESTLTLLRSHLMEISSQIAQTLADSGRGERLRDGISVVILGAPNAGKSSLLNRLAQRDAAIVSHQAGTTRDVIEVHLDIAGYPVVLVDTAGIRESSDLIESEGIRRALDRARHADITLVLFDALHPDTASLMLLDERSIAVFTKCDVLPGALPDLPVSPVCLSAKTGEGVDALLGLIQRRILDGFATGTPPFITRERHRALLLEALNHLNSVKENKPLELRCEELRRAGVLIGKITGKIQVDDVLDIIFSRFCIGK